METFHSFNPICCGCRPVCEWWSWPINKHTCFLCEFQTNLCECSATFSWEYHLRHACMFLNEAIISVKFFIVNNLYYVSLFLCFLWMHEDNGIDFAREQSPSRNYSSTNKGRSKKARVIGRLPWLEASWICPTSKWVCCVFLFFLAHAFQVMFVGMHQRDTCFVVAYLDCMGPICSGLATIKVMLMRSGHNM